jgi:hypothetical protein
LDHTGEDNPYSSNKKNKNGLRRCKRLEVAGKMWSRHLVYSKLGGLLFVTWLEHGIFRPCMAL